MYIIGLMIACNKKQETLPYYNTPDFEPVWNPGKEMKLHTIPAFSFINQNGKEITDKNLENNITIVNNFYWIFSALVISANSFNYRFLKKSHLSLLTFC